MFSFFMFFLISISSLTTCKVVIVTLAYQIDQETIRVLRFNARNSLFYVEPRQKTFSRSCGFVFFQLDRFVYEFNCLDF